MKIEAPKTLAEVDVCLTRLVVRRARQVTRLVKAHAIRNNREDRGMGLSVDRVLRIDRLLRDRFRDRVDQHLANLIRIGRGDDGLRRDALDIVDRAIRAWPPETKISAGILRFLADTIREAHEDVAVLRAWALLQTYTGGTDDSLRALVEQRGIPLVPLFERTRDCALRAGDHELALALNRGILDRSKPGRVDPLVERAWIAQLEIFRATGRVAAEETFAEKIRQWCREASREDLLDRVKATTRTSSGSDPQATPVLTLIVRTTGGNLEIAASGPKGVGLDDRPRQKALLLVTFAYPTTLSLDDVAHMLELMRRIASPKWPGPGGRLAAWPPPSNMSELAQWTSLARDRKVHEAVVNLAADMSDSCEKEIGTRLVRLVDTRVERDDPRSVLRVEIDSGAGPQRAQPSDVAGALRQLGIFPLVELGKHLLEQLPGGVRPGPGRPRTINSSMKRQDLSNLRNASADGISGLYSDRRSSRRDLDDSDAA